MKRTIIVICKAVLGAVFAVVKVFCRQRPKRVVFLSRQSNEPQLDFLMLAKELQRRDPQVECVYVCCRSDKGARELLRYAGAFLKSMRYLASSRVAVLNSYWPAVSMLKQRESLYVIQIWHALGKIKQSGWQTLDRDMGHSRAVAELMGMHRGYDVVIAGAKAWNPYYCASFGITEDKLRNVGLPRLDYLKTEGPAVRERFYQAYPELKGERIVMYAPTFRPGVKEGAERLFEVLADGEHGTVVFKRHPNQPIAVDNPHLLEALDFTSLDLLLVCDYVITDYSAIAVEAASVPVPIFYFCFDIDEYAAHNGFNVSPVTTMPHCVYKDPQALVRALDEPYPAEEFERYRAKYVLPDEDMGKSTQRIVDMIEGALSS